MSCKVHDLIKDDEILNKESLEFVKNYTKEITEYRIRGCTLGAKIVFLECSDSFSYWVSGKEKYDLLKNSMRF